MWGKTFNKIQHSFMTTTLTEVGMEGHFLNLIKALYQKLRARIIHKEATLWAVGSVLGRVHAGGSRSDVPFSH